MLLPKNIPIIIETITMALFPPLEGITIVIDRYVAFLSRKLRKECAFP